MGYPYSVRMQENTGQKKTPYLDNFHAVHVFQLKEFGVILDTELKFDEHISVKV